MGLRLVLAGVGLIGGSFALAQRRAGTVSTVVGMGRSRATLERARALGIVDQVAEDWADALAGADLVLVAAPVIQSGAILAAMAPHLEARTLITDAGSTKASVIDAAREALGERLGQFVPAHPIAGAEISGPDAATASLFDGRRVIVTPLPENPADALERVTVAWTATGARVLTMDAAAHDALLAAVSHLPHLIAFALVNHVATGADGGQRLAHVGSGFLDTTRIAASNPEMWRDVMLTNRPALLAEIDAYTAELATLRALIDAGDGAALEHRFAAARTTRRGIERARRAGDV